MPRRLISYLTAAAIGLWAVFFIAPTSLAQERPCGPHEQLTRYLSQNFGEDTVLSGLSVQGHWLEIMVNPETGTWTILGVATNGQACLLDSGENWRTSPYEPGQSS